MPLKLLETTRGRSRSMTAASGMRSDHRISSTAQHPEVMSKRPSLSSKHWLAKSISEAVSGPLDSGAPIVMDPGGDTVLPVAAVLLIDTHAS